MLEQSVSSMSVPAGSPVTYRTAVHEFAAVARAVRLVDERAGWQTRDLQKRQLPEQPVLSVKKLWGWEVIARGGHLSRLV